MPYDFPYRLEHSVTYSNGHYSTKDNYTIMRTGVGAICTGTDHSEMRKIVDALNEMAQVYAEEGLPANVNVR